MTGVAHLSFENELEAISRLRSFLEYIPLSNKHEAPIKPTNDDPYSV